MSRVLVVYGTTDGHTRRIAEALAHTLGNEGCRVDVGDTRDLAPGVGPEGYDGAVVAASVHRGSYQRAVTHWVRWHAAALNRKPSAFVSVCLGILERRPEVQREARAIMERFFARTGWRPESTKIVAGAVLDTRYHWLKRWAMKRKVGQAGGDTDTTRDFDYTDWNDVRAFAQEFAHRHGLADGALSTVRWA